MCLCTTGATLGGSVKINSDAGQSGPHYLLCHDTAFLVLVYDRSYLLYDRSTHGAVHH